MKKRFLIIVLALVMVISSACAAPAAAPAAAVEPAPAAEAAPAEAAPEAEAAPAAEAPAADAYKVAILLPGLISDAGWNAGGYYGAEYLNEQVEGVEATYIENVSTTNAEAAIRDYCEQGYNMVVGYSFDLGDYLMKVAPEYPNVQFVWSQGYMQTENVSTMSPQLQETAYLCGMIAAGITKTGVIGYIGGVDTMPMIAALEGYKEGARAVKPDVKIIHAFAGTWSDVEIGKQTAVALFEQGVDVLMGRGDGIALGCFQACIEKKVFCFGDATDQNELAPDLILTSTASNVGLALQKIIEDIQTSGDAFTPKNYSFGMRDGVPYITDFHGLVPEDIAKQVQETQDKIMSGELVIEAKTEISE